MMLKKVMILDLSNYIPGPMCSLYLADLGANVIKIESLSGDPMRSFEGNKTSPYFSAINRNKKSLAINLKNEEGKKIFMALAKKADVIIEGFRPGKVDSLGVGYSEVRKINPKIIYCSISGYGQKGPYKSKAGHDLNYAAVTGLLRLISKKPLVPGVQVVDASSALVAAFSILAGLYAREKSGKGCHIDVSMLRSALSFINIHISKASVPEAFDGLLYGTKPCYNIYQTKDKKYLCVAAIEPKFWESFCNAIGGKDLMPNQNNEKYVAQVSSIFRSKTAEEWVRLNNKFDFCCEPLKEVNEILSEVGIQDAFIDLSGIKQADFPAVFSSYGKMKHSKWPELGQDTSMLLSKIGYSRKSIKRLRRLNIIK